jgi:hypothetical protein
MVVRVIVKTSDGKWTEISVWVPFGSSLLVRADLMVSTCLQQPSTFSLQGLLIPDGNRGWDGRKPAYMPVDGARLKVIDDLEGVDAPIVFDVCKEKYSAHYLKKPGAYWVELLKTICGNICTFHIGKHAKPEFQVVFQKNDAELDIDFFEWEEGSYETVHDYKGREVKGEGLKSILWKYD